MRKMMIALALASVGLTALPASAQPFGPQPIAQRQIQQDINQLQNQINRAVQRRTISQREATGLRRDAVQIQRLYNSYSRNGLNRTEAAQLQRQVNGLQQKLHLEKRDRDNRRG